MEEKYVDVKGTRTRYLEAGSGEPLLLVHGHDYGRFTSANTFSLNIDALAKNFHVYAIDKIGAGFTDNPKSDKDYVIGTQVRHTYDFLKTMNINSAHLLGHSRGGYTVCRVALEHPEVCKTLIMVSSNTMMVAYSPIYDEWGRNAAKIEDLREKYRYLAKVNSYKTDHITDELVDQSIKVMSQPKTQEANEKMKAGRKWEFVEDLAIRQKETHDWIKKGKLKAPTLIVWGFNDPSAIFENEGLDLMRLIHSNVPESQMHVINRSGHSVFREHPETFNTIVTNFIKLQPGKV